jgi:sugar/nucleoside kinase (ribokinase family)
VVVGLGANSVDFVCTVPAAPSAAGPASKLRLTSHRHSPGGQVATALAACATFGLKTRYLGAFGNDDNGRLIRGEMMRRGIDVTHAVVRDVPNQFAVIVVIDAPSGLSAEALAQAGERIVLWDRDERLALTPAEVAPDALRGARVLHVDDVDVRASIQAAGIARSLGIDVTTDIDRAVDGVDELIRTATHPIFSEHVAASITGESDPERALRKLRRAHAGVLTITLGRDGAVALDGDAIVRVPGFTVTAVDTTGAGDIFRAGFIYGLIEGWPLGRMLRFANAAAAVSCTASGAMDSAPALAAVTSLLD